MLEYATLTKKKEINSRLRMVASFLSNEAEINRYNINQMAIGATMAYQTLLSRWQ